MPELVPGTPVKTLRTDRDSLEQREDHHGVILFRERGETYETYLVSWRDYPDERMLREEIEPLTEDERLDAIASYIMDA